MKRLIVTTIGLSSLLATSVLPAIAGPPGSARPIRNVDETEVITRTEERESTDRYSGTGQVSGGVVNGEASASTEQSGERCRAVNVRVRNNYVVYQKPDGTTFRMYQGRDEDVVSRGSWTPCD